MRACLRNRKRLKRKRERRGEEGREERKKRRTRWKIEEWKNRKTGGRIE